MELILYNFIRITGNQVRMTDTAAKNIALIIVALCVLSQISSASPNGGSSCCDDNTISVNGQGRFFVQPDIAIVSVGVSKTAKSSQDANRQVA